MGVGVWGACGPSWGPPWFCQTPSILARASVLGQQQETSGPPKWLLMESFMKGLRKMWAEGGKLQNLGLSRADRPQA